jgi:hypothetical protein
MGSLEVVFLEGVFVTVDLIKDQVGGISLVLDDIEAYAAWLIDEGAFGVRKHRLQKVI